ncbi:hypothetical protein SAMN04490206_1240 [Pseudomonas umsongensis]|jgi:hypothetical protein|nr:hypothetical protein PG5_66320 [Pseudomonas sp. G5(2012)]SDS69834.1 hypothetical protein SAMN04490206_1240 [Pseudomonas umsongensis]
MDFNDDAGRLDESVARTFFASRLAHRGSGTAVEQVGFKAASLWFLI